MSFSFAQPALPMTLRACRALVWTQGGLVALGGVFAAFTALAFGSGDSIPFHGGSVSGGAAAAVGAVYAAAGLTLAALGTALGRCAAWCLPAIVAMEAVLAVLYALRAFDLSFSTLLNLALVAAVLVLLVSPSTRHALAT